jgi:hypothetical protein
MTQNEWPQAVGMLQRTRSFTKYYKLLKFWNKLGVGKGRVAVYH